MITTFGRAIKAKRTWLDISVEELSKATGINLATIYRLEHNSLCSKISTIKKIIMQLDLGSDLLGYNWPSLPGALNDDFIVFKHGAGLYVSTTIETAHSMHFGHWLKCARKEKGYTQAELEMCTGVDDSTISKLETLNHKDMYCSNFLALTTYLGMPTDVMEYKFETPKERFNA